MALTLSDFPRPCFYKDLTELAATGRLRSALVLGDAAPGDLYAAIECWRSLLPDLGIFIICPSPVPAEVRDALQAVPGVAFLAADAEEGFAAATPLLRGGLSQDLLAPEIVVSCTPYDSYGAVVKQSLEAQALKIMEATGAFFVVHDPVYRIARIYDRSLLADRLLARPRRLRLYRDGVRLLLWLTALLSRLPPPGWRPVR